VTAQPRRPLRKVGSRDLAVPHVLRIDVAAAAAMKDELLHGVRTAIDGRGGGHDLVEIEAELPSAAAVSVKASAELGSKKPVPTPLR
jgi:hypothetical protein